MGSPAGFGVEDSNLAQIFLAHAAGVGPGNEAAAKTNLANDPNSPRTTVFGKLVIVIG